MLENLVQTSMVGVDDGRGLWQRTGFQFLAVSLVDGVVLAELPDLQLTKLSYRFEETTSETATLPWRDAPVNWREALMPYETAVLLVCGSTVLWGGIVVKVERRLGDSGLSFTLATVEHYLDSVYVQDHVYRNRDQCGIVEDLVESTLAGHRFNLIVKASPSEVRRDRTYEADDDKTLLSVLQELSNVSNGPEWCTMWRENGEGRYAPVLRVADRIGSTSPVTTFDESVMTSFVVTEDYTSGYGANSVLAVSVSDGGESRPQSDVMQAGQARRPVVEYVFHPSSSIKRKETLDDHARSALLRMRDGTRTVKLELSLTASPMIYQEWAPGDMVGWWVTDKARFPDVYRGSARVVGYEIDFTGVWTITPVLQ